MSQALHLMPSADDAKRVETMVARVTAAPVGRLFTFAELLAATPDRPSVRLWTPNGN